MSVLTFKLPLILCLIFSFSLFAQTQITPTKAVTTPIEFADDMDLENLELALDRQIENFKARSLTGKIRYGSKIYPHSILKDSAEDMRRIVRETRTCLIAAVDQGQCWKSFNNTINSHFDIYVPTPNRNEPGYGSSNTTLFTAYYSPDFYGSRTRTDRYTLPIYKLPPNASDRSLSREAIDFDHRLAGKGLELFWVEASIFELYSLHIEGGGRVHLQHEDGSEEFRYLSYAGKNGQRGEFISRHMLRKGYIRSTSMDEQEEFLLNNPQLHREIFSTYKPYVFFKETDDEPYGVQSIPLTEGRSVAVDTTIYKHIGVITFVQTKKAIQTANGSQQVPFSRFFVTQDTGGAIRGNARCDLYMGFGHAAAHAAHNMKGQGKQYFLIKK